MQRLTKVNWWMVAHLISGLLLLSEKGPSTRWTSSWTALDEGGGWKERRGEERGMKKEVWPERQNGIEEESWRYRRRHTEMKEVRQRDGYIYIERETCEGRERERQTQRVRQWRRERGDSEINQRLRWSPGQTDVTAFHLSSSNPQHWVYRGSAASPAKIQSHRRGPEASNKPATPQKKKKKKTKERECCHGALCYWLAFTILWFPLWVPLELSITLFGEES